MKNRVEAYDSFPGMYGKVFVTKIDLRTGEEIPVFVNNRIMLRSHVVLTHLLAQTPNTNEDYGSPELDAQLGFPTATDLRITRMRFGTDATDSDPTQTELLAPIAPGFDVDGEVSTIDHYVIDTYKYGRGTPIGDFVDFDAKISFETLMAGPQGNSGTSEFIEYREAGLFTENDIMFARTTLPPLSKNENFSFKFSWTVFFP